MIVVISPHRDDAAFSLALSIHHWIRSGKRVTVVNVFTHSPYAPYAAAQTTAEVSDLRRAEDGRFRDRFSGALDMIDLALDEALLRGYEDSETLDFMDGGPLRPSDEEALAALVEALDAMRLCGEVYVPLAFGDHIDHRITRLAAESIWDPTSLSYYEDLPYACGALGDVGRHAAAALGASARSQVMGQMTPISDKFESLQYYASQVSMTDIVAMLAHARALDGGERTWRRGP